jgi:polyisoprenyl-teichoic acid--peptidoglycan teichoic acid transferase
MQPTVVPTKRLRPPALPHWRKIPCAWLIFAAVMAPVFCCGSSLLMYLIFAPPQINILILGLDSRGSEGDLARTDAIMVLGIDPRRLEMSLLSIPRDVFIEVPGYGSQRVNTINVLGEQEAPGKGPVLVEAALEQTLGISIDRYARLDFAAFTQLVDAVGGVTVDIDRVIQDDAFPTAEGGTMSIRFEPGVQVLNGEQALIYARTRHGDDDYQRAARQQQVLSALMARLVNPGRWASAWNAVQSHMDTDLNAVDGLLYALPVILNRGRAQQLVIDRDYVSPGSNGVIPNREALEPWLREYLR